MGALPTEVEVSAPAARGRGGPDSGVLAPASDPRTQRRDPTQVGGSSGGHRVPAPQKPRGRRNILVPATPGGVTPSPACAPRHRRGDDEGALGKCEVTNDAPRALIDVTRG